jgi:predicted Zn-ribbon and HTH transcriptional regulator
MITYPYTCECGREKTRNATACPRCRYLDGATCGEQAIIMALRECSSPATITELVHATGQAREQVYRIFRRLQRAGRLCVRQGALGQRALEATLQMKEC